MPISHPVVNQLTNCLAQLYRHLTYYSIAKKNGGTFFLNIMSEYKEIQTEIENQFVTAIKDITVESTPLKSAFGRFDFIPRNDFEIPIFRNEGKIINDFFLTKICPKMIDKL